MIRWKCTVDAGILRNSAVVRTKGQGSASKTCGIQALISSRHGRPELGRSVRSEQWNLISCSQYFTLFSSNASSWSTAASSATTAGSFIPFRWNSVTRKQWSQLWKSNWARCRRVFSIGHRLICDRCRFTHDQPAVKLQRQIWPLFLLAYSMFKWRAHLHSVSSLNPFSRQLSMLRAHSPAGWAEACVNVAVIPVKKL
jgi:hypothetical protein